MPVIPSHFEPERLLIVRLSHLGDVVVTMPLAGALRERWPDAEIAWAVESRHASLLRGYPGIDRVIEWRRGDGIGAHLSFARELARFGADLALDAQGNAKSALWTRAARPGIVLGFHADDWQEPWAARAIGALAPRVGRERHAMERVLALARHATFSEVELGYDFDFGGEELERARTRFSDLGLEGTGRAVLVQLSRADDNRGWPTERWLELARALRAKGRAVALLGGSREREVAERLGELEGVARWIEDADLRELAAFLFVAAQRDARFIGVDSGPMHLAAAVGLPTTILHGSTDERRTGAWPPARHRVVRAKMPLECAPCLTRRCSHPEGPVCMSRVTTDAVLEAALS